jgi:hypothetical protein
MGNPLTGKTQVLSGSAADAAEALAGGADGYLTKLLSSAQLRRRLLDGFLHLAEDDHEPAEAHGEPPSDPTLIKVQWPSPRTWSSVAAGRGTTFLTAPCECGRPCRRTLHLHSACVALPGGLWTRKTRGERTAGSIDTVLCLTQTAGIVEPSRITTGELALPRNGGGAAFNLLQICSGPTARAASIQRVIGGPRR